MITELFLESQRVDISADISSLLTFAIDDVKDFASRQTTFSKTIILPGTFNNNKLFGNIFETGSSNTYNPSIDNIGYNFNASKSARCLMFQDNLQTFKGTMRLLQINKYPDIEYEVALNGELTNLNVALSSGLLTDLDFSAYDQNWNITNIEDSWDNNPGGSGVYFPLIDYGTYSLLKHDWDFRTLRPALYVKEYIDKMFAAANFRYTCDLFNTARFKGLVIPHNQKQLTKLTSDILTAESTASQVMIDFTAVLGNENVIFQTFSGGLFTQDGAQKIITYTGIPTIGTTVTVHLEGTYNITAPFEVHVSIFKNGVQHYYDNIPLQNTGAFIKDFVSIPLILATNDTFSINFSLINLAAGDADVTLDVATMSMSSDSAVTAPLDYDELIEMKFSIPQNVRQIDFLTSIVKLFNLYVYESQFDERLILMKPFVDFYSTDSGNAVDWTYKLNRDKPQTIKPMSEVNSKIYKFNYRDDNDYFNEQYKKRYNQGYGSYIFDSEFEFASQENRLELIFAATPLVGYAGEDKVYSTIFKKSSTTEETIDSVIRILQTKKITGVTSYDIVDSVIVSTLDSLTYYGYAGHLDDPDAPSNDLNFGALKELFFTLVTGDLTVTQFNVFWSSYLSEITDKDSKLLTAKFYLTPKDIFDLDFSKYIFLDSVLFRLNKISDYNATIPSDCECQLLRVINTLY